MRDFRVAIHRHIEDIDELTPFKTKKLKMRSFASTCRNRENLDDLPQ